MSEVSDPRPLGSGKVTEVGLYLRFISLKFSLKLWKEAEVEATIQYVVNQQGLPMAVFENKNRTFNTAI